MPANHLHPGALPARFRRPRVLIVGCGDVGLRAARLLAPRVRLLALSRDATRPPALRAQRITPLAGDLDQPATLARLAGLATHVLHLAPPPREGAGDARTQALARALRRRSPPAALVYGSTTGVYGDAQGARVAESRPPRPQTGRAQRRAAAERAVRALGRGGVRAAILRIAGIYAPDRPNGNPRPRLLRGDPMLAAPDDVYIAHIHADDLARACALALWRGAPQRAYNVCDDSAMKMGEYFDLAARLYTLPPLPRVSRAEAEAQLSPAFMSYLRESRRMDNRRLKRELRLALRHPTPATGLISQP